MFSRKGMRSIASEWIDDWLLAWPAPGWAIPVAIAINIAFIALIAGGALALVIALCKCLSP